jgi:hypothetical protein
VIGSAEDDAPGTGKPHSGMWTPEDGSEGGDGRWDAGECSGGSRVSLAETIIGT